MNKINRAFILKRIRRETDKIAKSRDALRDIEVDMQMYKDDTEEALDDLRAAIDALSKHL